MVNSKNDDRIRKKSTSKAYKNKKFKNKKREWNFNPNIFSVVMMVLSIFMFIFIISSNTGKLGNVITKSFENTFGKLGMALPIIIFISFFFAYRDKYKENIKDFLLLYLLFLVSLAFMSKNFYRNDLDWTIENSVQRSATSGGLVGGFLSYYIISFIGSLGLNILFVISIFLFVVGISPLTYREFLQKVRNFLILIKNKLIDLFSSINDKRNEKKIVKNEEKLEKIEQKPVSKTAGFHT